MKLNNKQKKYLKSLAVSLDPVVIIGKDGLTHNVVESIKLAITAHELVKVKALKTVSEEINAIAIEIAADTNSEVVSIIGSTIVLYKESKKKKINLPK